MCLRILTRCSYILFFKPEISERAGRVDSKDVDRDRRVEKERITKNNDRTLGSDGYIYVLGV